MSKYFYKTLLRHNVDVLVEIIRHSEVREVSDFIQNFFKSVLQLVDKVRRGKSLVAKRPAENSDEPFFVITFLNLQLPAVEEISKVIDALLKCLFVKGHVPVTPVRRTL